MFDSLAGIGFLAEPLQQFLDSSVHLISWFEERYNRETQPGAAPDRLRQNCMNAPGTIYDVLVVDDSPVYRKLVEQVLESQPFRLHFAQNGEEALRVIEEFSPAIVVTDWMMAGFFGPGIVPADSSGPISPRTST